MNNARRKQSVPQKEVYHHFCMIFKMQMATGIKQLAKNGVASNLWGKYFVFFLNALLLVLQTPGYNRPLKYYLLPP